MQANPALSMTPSAQRPAAVSLSSFSLWFGLGLVLLTTLHHGLRDTVAAECLWGMLHVMRAMFAALLLASLLTVRLRREQGAPHALRPLLVNGLTLFILLFVPLSNMWQETRFELQQQAYVTAAGWIDSGVLTPDAAGWVTLPTGYTALSGSGQARVTRSAGATTVFFPGGGALGGSSGILYRSDGLLPQPGDFGLQWVQVTQAGAHWFFVTGR